MLKEYAKELLQGVGSGYLLQALISGASSPEVIINWLVQPAPRCPGFQFKTFDAYADRWCMDTIWIRLDIGF